MFKIPPNIKSVLNILNQNGFEAYIVGGCVRDILLNKTPNDFDITTDAKPDNIVNLFEKTIPTGIKHGTVTVIADNQPIEVTTFRADGDYTDFRRPTNIIFVNNLKQDLKRRDFTVNALAYNHKEGLKDYFGGVEDLNNKILRAVGDPETRFKEDALRILRLFRFASTLNFTIEEKTLTEAINCRSLLQNVSRERIFEEIKKAVTGDNFSVFAPLIECGGLDFLNIRSTIDFEKIKKHKNNPLLCLYLFLGQKGLENLKPSNKEKEYFKTMDLLSSMPCNTGQDIKEMLNLSEISALNDYFALLEKSPERIQKIINSGEPYSIKHLNISGNDLINLGYSGEKIGNILENLRKFVISDPSKNTKKDLLEKVRKQ